MDDFQYIDIYEIEGFTTLKSKCHGPTFHLKPQCPVCSSCYSELYCGKCVNSGVFIISNNPEKEISYIELSRELKVVNKTISSLCTKHPQFSSIDSKESSKRENVECLRKALREAKDVTRHKHLELTQIQKALRKHEISNDELIRTQRVLLNHLQSVSQRNSVKRSELASVNKQLHITRSERIKELLFLYFPINISTLIDRADTIAGTPLNIDKTNPFSGPEPTTSSHAALAYSVIASRTTAQLYNVWLPPTTRNLLRLTHLFSGAFPLRDDLACAYAAVSRSVQMICTSCGLTSFPAEVIAKLYPREFSNQFRPTLVDYTLPLAGLYLLSQSARRLLLLSRDFDQSYIFTNPDLFDGRLVLEDLQWKQPPPPIISRPICSLFERRTEEQTSLSMRVPTSDSTSLCARVDDSESSCSVSPDWEIVTDDQFED